MCQVIYIRESDKEITTPQQFKEHFGVDPLFDYGGYMDSCLCQIDIEENLKACNVSYTINDCLDYYTVEPI